MKWEFLALFLLELGFMAIIGIMYTVPVVILVSLCDWIEKKWNERKDKDADKKET